MGTGWLVLILGIIVALLVAYAVIVRRRFRAKDPRVQAEARAAGRSIVKSWEYRVSIISGVAAVLLCGARLWVGAAIALALFVAAQLLVRRKRWQLLHRP